MSTPPPARPQPAGSRDPVRQKAHRTWQPWADPAHAHDHVQNPRAIGTCQAVGKPADAGQMTVREIAHRSGLQPQRVDANGSMWRLRSLIAMGHTSARITTALGASSSIVEPLVRGDRATVTASLRDDITRLFDAWWDKQPPRRTPAENTAACKAMQRAATSNWPCPAALDDDELDLPGYTPTARWRYAHGTGNADNDPLGKKRHAEPEREAG